VIIGAAMATTSSPVNARESAGGHNLPAPLTALIGREREIEAIGATLRRTRLVTITGPGGVGKTRLALELAHRQMARQSRGAWMVDLSSGPDEPDVAAETARALDVRSPAGTTTTEALRRYLANRDLTLVLDNCEHVVGQCAELATTLLATCEKVRILATSRESLAINGETVWRLEPLVAEDAHRLFVERARQRQPDFLPGEDTDATIAQLCERLDRLPLAIELAAARVGIISPAEILSSLQTRLGELGGGRRLSPPRHRTVRAGVDWSYQLLDLTEQEALRSLSVFVGGFDADAASAVAPGLTFDGLARLVDKSLVAVAESPRGRTRYRLLETVREYAAELLAEADGLAVARERHLRHFSAVGSGVGEGWPSAGAISFVARLGEDYRNVRAALEWGADSDPCSAAALLAATKDLFFMLGQSDGLRLARLLLERCPERDRARVEMQISAGLYSMMLVDKKGAWEALEEARELAAELGERSLEAWARFFEGLTETLGGTVEPGRRYLEESRAIHRELGGGIGESRATAALGLTYCMEGDTAHARKLVDEALSISAAEEDDWGRGQCHTYLGIITEAAGSDLDEATSHYHRAVDCLRQYRDATLLPVALVGQAGLLGHRNPARALRVAAAAFAIRARVGGDFAPLYRARAERVREAAEAALGADAPRAWTEGSQLSVDEAVALAFRSSSPRPSLPAGMSARQMEIADLVAEGLSNKAIASRLHLSVRTVESHVRNALAKVALDNRTQLAAWVRNRVQ
jgi:non-specific serine/threonine protein kinase